MKELPYLIAAVVTLMGGFTVGKKNGAIYGILAGLAIFIAVTLILVALGFGYRFSGHRRKRSMHLLPPGADDVFQENDAIGSLLPLDAGSGWAVALFW